MSSMLYGLFLYVDDQKRQRTPGAKNPIAFPGIMCIITIVSKLLKIDQKRGNIYA